MGAKMAHSQNAAGKIDMSRISQRKIRSLINNQFEAENITEFNDIQASWHKGQNLKGYRLVQSVYYLNEPTENVWKAYQSISPAISWNGSMVSFGVLFSKWNNTVLYKNDNYYPGLDTGQIFYVNLRIMKGLYNLAVGLEIINIDSLHRSVTFSYLKGGKSQGEQTIYFIPTKKGNTEIIHETAFRSGSFFRDRYLYPYFHRIAINEFHKNMRRSMLVSHKELAQQ